MIKFFFVLTCGVVLGAGGMFYYRHDVAAKEAQIQQTKRDAAQMSRAVNEKVQNALK